MVYNVMKNMIKLIIKKFMIIMNIIVMQRKNLFNNY